MEGIDGYRLVRRIGAGGMGTVHEAVDADGNRVAVKVLHAAIAADPAARQRLRREVELLHRVRGERVARVLDAEVDGADAFVVTELIDGPTLDDDVRENGPLADEELAGLAHGLAQGLDSIHAAGITHRDLKPGNVMLAPHGPVIIDFGIAQVADDVRLTQTGMITGTPGYLDPDVIEGTDPGPAGDWWAWAAVLTFAATGRPPFGRGGIAAVLARVSTGVVDTEGLPERLATVLRAALDPEPARRLPPGELLAALDGDWQRPAVARLLAEPAPEPPAPRTDVLRLPPAPIADPPVGATRVMPPAPAQPWPVPAQGPPPQSWPAPAEGRPPQSWPVPAPGPPGYGPPATYPAPGAGPVWPAPPPGDVPAWARAPRRRTGTAAACGLGLSAAAVVIPGWWLVAVVTLLVVLGAVGRGARRLRQQRIRRGRRRGDAAQAALGAPLYLLWAAAAALPGLLLAVVLAAGGWWLVHALASPPGEADPWLLWGAALLGTGIAWTVPPSGGAREGARLVLGWLPRPLRTALALLALAAAVVVAVVVLAGIAPAPDWTPLSSPA